MQCHIATSLKNVFSNNIQNVVVATQPTAMPAVTIVDPRLKPKPTVMIVTIVLTVVCLVQGCWPALVCMAPALIAAVVVSCNNQGGLFLGMVTSYLVRLHTKPLNNNYYIPNSNLL